ncbi:MAG TPA: penicillin-binding protein 1C [Flavisolibacter sp.]|nr:penicillin-binding protein 1C [Flavisolibacter sp.]
MFVLLNLLFPLPDKIAYSVIVRDAADDVVNAYLTPDDKWRMETELTEISPLLRKTIIAKEDKYFYRHPGINPFAIGRAAINNIVNMKRTSGASTITMQVAKALEPKKRNIGNKLVEMFRAFQLEWKYDKDEILQLYLNLVPYGSNIEGVKAASLLYFNKAPDHLSLAEITALSIIPNRPSSLIIGKANDVIIKERNRWLNKFAADDVFTSAEIRDAEGEPLTAVRRTVPHFIPHFSYKLKKERGSNNIRTAIVLNTQLKIEKLTEDYVRGLKLKGIRNAAVVVIDNKTHKVISYIGSAGFNDTTDGGQVNGAAAIRQPGSTLKPLLYALCMDEGLVTPKMVLNDVPVNYAGYAPENYDKEFRGAVTMEYALEHSLNIPSVRSLKALGKDKLIEKLVAANFKQIQKDQNKLGLSMILGGCGASLEELTGLFSVFANNGIYTAPRYVQEATSPKLRLISPEASYLITDALSKVNRPDFPVNWTATERMPKIAWKTGTSYGRRDAWSIGYNKDYTIGVWCGNFSGVGVADLSGANTATPLLFKIFNTIDYDSNADWYEPPQGCELRQVCSESGLPPGPNCTNLISDYFFPMVSRTNVCGHLQEVKVSPDSSISYCKGCAPLTGYIKKLYAVTAPEMQDYFSKAGTPYQIIPLHNPACEGIFKGEGPAITSPQNKAEYFINKKDPEPLQLTASVPADVSKIYWYINDRFYKVANRGEKQFFVPEEGPVKISCSDDKGRSKSVRILVKKVML